MVVMLVLSLAGGPHPGELVTAPLVAGLVFLGTVAPVEQILFSLAVPL